MANLEKEYTIILVVSAVFNILLNLLLIPQYGITGASIATVISLLQRNILSVIVIYRKKELAFWV